MKQLSSYNQTATDKPYVDLVRVARIEFDSLTLNLTDRVFGTDSLCTFDGTVYEPVVVSWGTIQTGRINPESHETSIASATIEIDNSVTIGGYDRLTELLAVKAAQYVKVTLSLLFNGADGSGNIVPLFVGKIEDIEGITDRTVSLQLSGYELDVANKFPAEYVEATTFSGADPDDLGKMLPVVYGQAKRVPLRAIDAGGLTSLAEDLDDSETSIDVTDADRLPATGTVYIDEEQISYTGKTGDTLTGCTRGANATTAVAHNLGAAVAEKQTEYIYAIGHAVKAIDAVYVDGVKIPSGNYTAYTGQTGDQHGTYSGRAVVSFSALPKLEKIVNIELDDNLTVSDDIDFAAPETTIETYPDGNSGTGSNPANAYDGSENTYCDIYNAAATRYHEFSFTGDPGPATNRGTITYHEFWVLCATNATGAVGVSDDQSNSLGSVPASFTKGWIRFQATDTDWDLGIRFDTGVNEQIQVYEIKRITYYDPDLTKTGSASRGGTLGLSGNSVADNVIGGMVSADIDGYQDDSSGSITGTPAALIERPDHICQHLLEQVCGASFASASAWSRGGSYSAGDLVSYNGGFFDCLAGHTADAIVDYTGYTESDPGSRFTVAANKITVAALSRTDANQYIYYDFGAGYFDGDFRIDFEIKITGTPAANDVIFPVYLGNAVGDAYYNQTNSTGIGIYYAQVGTDQGFKIFENPGASVGNSSSGFAVQQISASTKYYFTFERLTAFGSYGFFIMKIFSDSARTDLLFAERMEAASLLSYRYLYVASGYNLGAASSCDCDIENHEIFINRPYEGINSGSFWSRFDIGTDWQPETAYVKGDLIWKNGGLYKCIADHTSDSYQDFTSFTESDPGYELTVDNSRKVTFAGLGTPDDTLLYKDFGANYFQGDHKVFYKLTVTAFNQYGLVGAALSSHAECLDTRRTNTREYNSWWLYSDPTSSASEEGDGSTTAYKNDPALNDFLTEGTYYVRLFRDETNSRIKITFFYDEDMTVEILSFYKAITDSSPALRYLIAVESYGSSGTTGGHNGYIEDMILHKNCPAIGTASGSYWAAADIASIIDYGSYTEAGAFYNTNSYVLAFALLEKPNVRALLGRIAMQSKSIQFWEAGRHHLVHIPASASADLSLTGFDIDLNQIWVRYADRVNLINSIEGRFDRYWSGYVDDETADRNVVKATDATSITAYGTLKGNPFKFPYIPGSTQAQAVLDWILENKANPLIAIELIGGFSLLPIEKGDVIAFTDNSQGSLLKEDGDALLKEDGDALLWETEGDSVAELRQALLGLVSLNSDLFRVMDIKYFVDAIQIELIEEV